MASHGQVVQRSAATTSQAQTVVTTETQTPAPPVPILRLRGAHASRRRVQWTEDVVDNEGLGRKSSKVCCIYHRPKGVDESSDESSSSSDSSSDSDSDADRRKPANHKDHDHDKCPDHGDHGDDHGRRRRGGKESRKRRPSPNAYERVPKQKSTPKPEDDGSKGAGPGEQKQS